MNSALKWLGAALIAFVLSSGHLLSGPSEMDAIEDVADEVASLSGGGK